MLSAHTERGNRVSQFRNIFFFNELAQFINTKYNKGVGNINSTERGRKEEADRPR